MDGVDLMGADPSYSVATGLIAWGFDKEFGNSRQKGGRFSGASRNSAGAVSRVTDWLKNFLP
ncbi:MAG: hypothetical protein A2302_01975 [Candidatus Yanofskybacteria bacterium RIFOXYB2_FULL_44_18]|nr:MAG: hypothetical protein A2302_01975 [Candidatus Yanofskybacteria bacterium RIFOXYB2_FULL_44_18]